MNTLNSNQKTLKRMIQDTKLQISDEELFLSAAFQKHQTSLAKAATGRSRYGLQVITNWDTSEDAGVAYTDNYKIHCNAGNPITQSFPSRFLRALSISGFTGHETAHLRYSDFTSLNLYLTKLEQGIFYPEPPEINYPEYQRNLDVITEAMEEKDRAVCLTLSRCAAQINNILEDIYIEARMCEDCPGTFKQGIQMNHFRMTELIPDIHDQIAQGYQPFSIMSNLLLSYCRTGNINNRTDYSGEYMDTGIAEEKYEQELTEELQKTADEINYGNAHAGIHVTVHRMNTVSDFLIREYSQIATPLLRASKRLQNSILPLLKDEAEGGKQKNLMFGKRLDMRVLHREDGTIFTRTRLPNDEQRLAVGLLVDESGSMDWGDRITHARKTAIVLYDFCISLGIPITIYGHSTGYDDVDLYSYAEFDSLDASDRYRLMDMSARGGNRDGAALRFVAEHLAKRPETRKLLIIISDGQPAAGGYSGTAAEADLRGIKKEFQKRGVITFAAAIGDDKENIRRIYKDGFLDITRLEDLPKNMTQLVKQYLK